MSARRKADNPTLIRSQRCDSLADGLGAGAAFALVCYLPEPQKSMVETLRASIPGHPLSPPHITILPPRPLHISLDEVWSQVESALGGWRAFAVELSAVRCFRESDFLYLDVAAGNEQLHAMHDKLGVGPLNHAEMYGF